MRYRWPDEHVCAVALTFDVDAEAPLVHRDPEQARDQLAEREERLFGVRVGVDRLLRLLDDCQVPATFFVPAYTVRTHLDVVRRIQAAGHELGCHGDLHERLDGLGEAEEDAILQRQLTDFEDLLGIRPVGYRAPSWELNERTPLLLREYGFRYDSSLMGNDIPYTVDTPLGSLVEVPVHWMLDDAPLYRHVYGSTNGIADPGRVIDLWRREFRGMRRESGCFVLTMHPWITGRASRVDALRDVVDDMRDAGGVWFASAEDIAAWHLAAHGGVGKDEETTR